VPDDKPKGGQQIVAYDNGERERERVRSYLRASLGVEMLICTAGRLIVASDKRRPNRIQSSDALAWRRILAAFRLRAGGPVLDETSLARLRAAFAHEPCRRSNCRANERVRRRQQPLGRLGARPAEAAAVARSRDKLSHFGQRKSFGPVAAAADRVAAGAAEAAARPASRRQPPAACGGVLRK
jgi:hypothetical protein